jgi:hypothetical protein
MIMDGEKSVDADEHILTSILRPFPDKEKMTDGRGLLPLHIAVALGNKIRDVDVHTLRLNDPLGNCIV